MREFDPTSRFRESFRPLGELFNQVIESLGGSNPRPASSGSFLWLDPHKPAVQFFGIESQRRTKYRPRESAEMFLREVKKIVDTKLPQGHQDLLKIVKRLASLDDYPFIEAYQGAVDLLHLTPFPPGNAYKAVGEGLVAIPHWCLSAPGDSKSVLQPLTHFQDALDLAALYGFDLKLMRREREESREYKISPRTGGQPVVAIVQNYAARQSLITTENVHMYVAEYVQTLGPNLEELCGQSVNPLKAIDEYFMPMRGLGQWRASFEYKALKKSNDRAASSVEWRQLTQWVRCGLEELFTRALVNSFAHLLLDANVDPPDDLYRAFATLWWAREVRFWSRDNEGKSWRLVTRLAWCPYKRALVPLGVDNSDPARPKVHHESYGRTHDGWLSVEQGDPGRSRGLSLDFNKLLTEEDGQREEFSRLWGFDLVEFECDLVDATSGEFHRWADILGDELVQVRTRLFHFIRVQAAEIKTARAEAEYSTALFAYGHHVGKLFQESGLIGLDPSEHGEHESVLASMKNRLMIAWGVGEMATPLRHQGRGYPARWFPREPQPVDPQNLSTKLRAVCQYYLSGLMQSIPSTWTVEWHVGTQNPIVQSIDDLVSKKSFLPSVPPFVDTNRQQPATAALTIGLAEQLRNLRQHWLDNLDPLVDGFQARAFEHIAKIFVKIYPELESCSVEIIGVVYYRHQEHIRPDQVVCSISIGEIKNLENRALSINGDDVVETLQFSFMDNSGEFRRVRSLWKYNYGKVRRAPEEEVV